MSIDSIAGRRIRIWLTAAALAVASACAVAPSPLSMEAREKLGPVTIAPARYVPQSNLRTFAKSKPAGAARDAAGTAAVEAILFGAVIAGTSGIGAAALAFMAPYVIVTGAAIGAEEGARRALPAEKAQAIESTLNDALARLDTQRELADHLTAIVKSESWVDLRSVDAKGPAAANESPAYGVLASEGIDTVIEIAVREIGFDRCETTDIYGTPNDLRCPPDFQRKPMVSLYMLVQARLVRVSDGTELFARQFRYTSPHREFALWAANDGRMLVGEFERAYRDLAERVNDDLLLVTPIELPNVGGFDALPDHPLYGMCGLVPVYPKAEPIPLSEALSTSFFNRKDLCLVHPMRFGAVDSLRPTLRWSPFPRELDREKLEPALLTRIGDVSYDLKLWEAERCERGRLVYERAGLVAPEHRLEESLAPGQRYFWSFRARFTVDGRLMVTGWASFDANTCQPDDNVPEWWSYKNHRFVTPR